MKSIRWGWVLLGGLVAEILIFAIAIPIAIFAGEGSLLYTAPTASLIATLVCGWWVAKKATRHRVLYGILVGAAAIVIYLAMSPGRPEGIVNLSEPGTFAKEQSRISRLISARGHGPPYRKGSRSQESVVLGSDKVASESEQIVDHAMEVEEPLGLMGRLESTHLPFPLARRLMRRLHSIVSVTLGSVSHVQKLVRIAAE